MFSANSDLQDAIAKLENNQEAEELINHALNLIELEKLKVLEAVHSIERDLNIGEFKKEEEEVKEDLYQSIYNDAYGSFKISRSNTFKSRTGPNNTLVNPELFQ